MTSERHKRLCELAGTYLRKCGFKIEYEKWIIFTEDNKPEQRWSCCGYSVDVYGERDGEIVMYEIGTCSKTKLGWLRKYIGETIHVPYTAAGVTTKKVSGRKW